MALSTSTSTRKLPIINTNCALRRNVKVQPYGRCSVCSLHLQQCHAWQGSAISFVMVILIVVPLIAHDPWIVRGAIAAVLALLVLQGMSQHKRTDELIWNEHRLRRLSAGLEREVEARTAKLSEANAALAAANLELEELAKEREKMVLDVSHDLRTPMTSVKGAAQNLLDGIAGPLSTSQHEYVEIIHDHAQRLVGAVSQMLDRASRGASQVELAVVSLDLGDLSRQVARGLEPVAGEKGVTVVLDARPTRCTADPEKMRKVIENLLGNAIKFSERGGQVRVRIESTGRDVRLVVSDQGVGMTELELEHVFDRFYRAGSERPGTGLGLAIVRDLVRLHRGEITVKSQPGSGSEFAVSLPQVPA
jgi:signal transduction histidine kinase